MRLTRFGFKGVVFYGALLGAFFAAPYSNLFFLLLAFLTLQWCASLFSALRNLRGVQVEVADLAPVSSGSSIDIPVALRADPRPRFQLVVKLELDESHVIQGDLELLESQGRATLKGTPLERGCYSVRRALVESCYPFGLLRLRRAVSVSGELLVFPAPASVLEGRSAADALDDLLDPGQNKGEDQQPAGLRDHREGDDVRHIHWRASARHQRLILQEWESGGGQGLEVVLDRRCTPEQLESALSTISAMVVLARTNKETLALHSQSLSASFGEGQRPWCEVLRFLALAQTVASDGPAPPPVSPSVARLPRALASA